MQWIRWGRLLPFALAAAGCYNFQPTETPRPGTDIRARLNVEAAVRRSIQTEEPRRSYDGRIVAIADDVVYLDVLIARGQSAFQEVVIRDTMRFTLSEIETIYEKRLAPFRSALFGVGMVAGAVLVVKGITTLVGGTEGEPGNGNGGFLQAAVPTPSAAQVQSAVVRLIRSGR